MPPSSIVKNKRGGAAWVGNHPLRLLIEKWRAKLSQMRVNQTKEKYA